MGGLDGAHNLEPDLGQLREHGRVVVDGGEQPARRLRVEHQRQPGIADGVADPDPPVEGLAVPGVATR